MLELDALAADLRDNAFGARRRSVHPPALGAEVELIAWYTDGDGLFALSLTGPAATAR